MVLYSRNQEVFLPETVRKDLLLNRVTYTHENLTFLGLLFHRRLDRYSFFDLLNVLV